MEKYKLLIKTEYEGGKIHQSVQSEMTEFQGETHKLLNIVHDTLNAEFRRALIEMGWTPPADEGKGERG